MIFSSVTACRGTQRRDWGQKWGKGRNDICGYTQVGHKLRFSLVLINDSCVVQVRNSTLLRTLRAIALLDYPHPEKNRNLCPTW